MEKTSIVGVTITSRVSDEVEAFNSNGVKLLPTRETISFDIKGVEYIADVDRSDSDRLDVEWQWNGEDNEVPEEWSEIEDYLS